MDTDLKEFLFEGQLDDGDEINPARQQLIDKINEVSVLISNNNTTLEDNSSPNKVNDDLDFG